MPKLALAASFLTDYGRLEKRVQRGVSEVVNKFRQLSAAELRHDKGLHLEHLNNAKDRRTRTIRIDRFWRGVVMAPEGGGETYVLLKVLPHDDAIAWAMKRVYSVNSATGGLEVRDVEAIEASTSAFERAAPVTAPRIFVKVSDGELKTLGLDKATLRFARTLTRKDQLEASAEFLPEDQFEVLQFLAEGFSVEEVWRDVVAVRVPVVSAAVDDLDAAIESTSSRIALVDGPEELADILEKPLTAWRIFLHPSQRKVAYRPSYAGPAQVTGGPGTGKTVVALHRVAFLLRHLRPGERILLTTYTNALAKALREALADLVDDPERRSWVDVSTVDAYARKVVSAHGTVPTLIGHAAEDAYWAAIVDAGELTWAVPFLAQEYRHVVLAQDIRTEEAYRKASRTGRGSLLAASRRPLMWRTLRTFEDKLTAEGKCTWLQLCRSAADVLAETGPEYRHVVVDEAQDLHPAQWRVLRAAVAARPDDLFIAGDPHQRIYDSKVSLRSLGINVVGRTTKMRKNYRSTQEILSWSAALMRAERVAELADSANEDTLFGYRSSLHGQVPSASGADSVREEDDHLVAQVKGWLAEGVTPDEIGIAVRFKKTGDRVRERLAKASIPAAELRTDTTAAAGRVRVGTMHSFKGLEFRCVAVPGVSQAAMPWAKALTDASVDRIQHETDVMSERCLLFVACTRARERLYVSWTGAPSRFLMEAGAA